MTSQQQETETVERINRITGELDDANHTVRFALGATFAFVWGDIICDDEARGLVCRQLAGALSALDEQGAAIGALAVIGGSLTEAGDR